MPSVLINNGQRSELVLGKCVRASEGNLMFQAWLQKAQSIFSIMLSSPQREFVNVSLVPKKPRPTKS